ncbi:MAG: hypothetical protein HFP77_04595 [Methylococcales symbiont of Iophon sp. n. MRB-2018]|nr:MAG: hypothetical protein HFP77_04595 [Methylococcales symbiont of Iophon sp. n. MRB-2018]KAF3980046.1 MAG: hypothetical protein HFP76_04255 [Methylococcales symbiont of Iophon sp. n. MRB-2018]
MKISKICFLFALYVMSNQAIALSTGGIGETKIITGNMKATPGCKNKEVASKQASTGYRFKKYSKVMCQQIAYGWSLVEVQDRGEVVCETCEGEEGKGDDNYRCYVKNVKLLCGITNRGY